MDVSCSNKVLIMSVRVMNLNGIFRGSGISVVAFEVSMRLCVASGYDWHRHVIVMCLMLCCSDGTQKLFPHSQR